MGAWGSGHFQNDDAGDFVGGLVESPDWSIVDAAFDAVLLIGGDYLEAPEASIGIAAADMDPEDLSAAGSLGVPSTNIVAKARAALLRIKKQSELGDLWEEAGAKDEWLATVDLIEQVL